MKLSIILLLLCCACSDIAFVEPFNNQPRVDASPDSFAPQIEPANPLPGPRPQPSICPIPGGGCETTSPFQETCINYESYWACEDGHWKDRWCGAYPAAICQNQHCIGPNYCP